MRGLWPFLCRLKYETVVVHLNDGSEVLGVVEEIDPNMNTELRHVKVIRGTTSISLISYKQVEINISSALFNIEYQSEPKFAQFQILEVTTRHLTPEDTIIS